ncbi:hypothetical protein ACFQ0K_01965 [Nocardioides caeni]|uniref:Uncharacterized protein n=1 Tax=Nocardioides caeni TaxID=574700 RepID=A0A4S8NT47_9ACTN|nr:hypothetical protein [Nocardioides caeni]THV18389.1 hypothetical protein E9934_01800 [Nocardioides caeni]
MHRAVIKILVVLALALGLGLTSASASSAAPAAAPAAKAGDCTNQASAVAVARRNYNRQVSQQRRAQRVHANAVRAERKATGRKAKRAAHTRVVRAKNRVAAERRDVRVSKNRVVRAKRNLSNCRNNGGPDTSPTSSPIQTLCDAGLPQTICDGLASLLPTGGTTANPLSLLCAQVPEAQALCNLISTGTAPDPQDLLEVIETVLDDLGLLDLISGLLNGLGLGSLLGGSELDDLLDLLGFLG